MGILLLLPWFLLPILVLLRCVGSVCAVRFKAEAVLRLLSIDAMRPRYFHIFLHIYRTLVAGSEASVWNGRCQRICMKLSHVPRAVQRLVTAALYITCVVSPLTEPQTYSVSDLHPRPRQGRRAMSILGLGISPSIDAFRCLSMRRRARRQISFASWNPPNGYTHL